MLREDRLRSALPIQGLGEPFEFHPKLGSTNDRAAALARAGGPHGALVVAEEQTAGRGRAGTRWHTPAGSALALSLVLRPPGVSDQGIVGMPVVGALAVVEALAAIGVEAWIKWPNDILLERRKVAGVLVEASWEGAALDWVILGIGVNVRSASAPPEEQLSYPATCVEDVRRKPVDRESLLLAVLEALGGWLPRMGTPELHRAWEQRMAFRGERIGLWPVEGGSPVEGILAGLTLEGLLRLEGRDGGTTVIRPEGVHLRPVDKQR